MIRRAVFWSFSSQIANFIVQFGSSVIVARLLSPKELGIFAVAMAIMGIVQMVAAFGVGAYVMREEHLTSQTMYSAFTVNTVISVVLALCIFASSFASGVMFHEADVSGVLRLLCLPPLLAIPSFLPSVMLQRAMQMRGISIIGTLSAFLTSAVTIGCAYRGLSSMSPAYGSVAGALFTTIFTMVIGRRHVRVRFSFKEWRPIAAFGLRLMSISGISTAAVRVSDIILGHFLGLAALGLYSRATNLSSILFTNVYGGATRVVFSKLSDARRNGDRMTEVYLHGFRVITAVMAPLLLGLAVLSRPAVYLLYGEKWLGAAWPLSLLLIGQLIALSFAMNWELFVLRDELKTQTRLEMTRSLLAVAGQAIGAAFSLVAAAASSIVVGLLSYAIYSRHMPRLAHTDSATFHRSYAEAAYLAVVAALPPLGLMLLRGWAADTPVMEVFGSVLLGMLLWLVAITRADHPVVKEINIALGKLTRRRVQLGPATRTR